MPYCAILECKNDSRRKNISNGGVSYHRFPKDGSIKEKWINSTGRNNWMPTKSSTICSEHFTENQFLISKKGHRYLTITAVPTIKIVMICDQKHLPDTAPGPSKRQAILANTSVVSEKKAQLHEGSMTMQITDVVSLKNNEIESSSSAYSTPKQNESLNEELRWSQDKIKKLVAREVKNSESGAASMQKYSPVLRSYPNIALFLTKGL
ncbi:peroxynitrite isomerase THAP4-like [Aphomia sociella]